MGLCINCNKSGILVAVDSYGLCRKCGRRVNGLIRHHGLIPFWLTLSQLEREKCVESHDGVGISTSIMSVGLVKGSVLSTSQTKSALLSAVGANLISRKEYELSAKVLLEAVRSYEDIIDLHFAYNHLIEVMYKQREEPKCLEMCIQYCKKDIEMYPVFIKEWDYWMEKGRLAEISTPTLDKHREEMRQLKERQIADGVETRIYIPSFERLAIIYEKQKNIQDAINICELAIRYNLISLTKAGFEGRLEKLKKKL